MSESAACRFGVCWKGQLGGPAAKCKNGCERGSAASTLRRRRPSRRLAGLCLYCGRPSRTDVCGYCSDLPLRDPLVSKARLPLSEQERMTAAKHVG